MGGLHNSSSMWVFVFAPLFLSKTLVLNYTIFCDFYPIFLFKIHVTSKFKEKSHINPCHAEYIKMPCPLLVFSQSDYLIQLVHTNSNTWWQTVQIQISWLLQKPTDLDLYCLQRQGISGFSRTRFKILKGEISNTVYRYLLSTHLCLASHKRDIGKQCRPTSVWSGSKLFALNTELSIKHGDNKNYSDTLFIRNGPVQTAEIEESIWHK